jgi:hypothetical protein
VTVQHKLSCLRPGIGEAESVNDIIQASFHQDHQVFTGNARLFFSYAESLPKLSLQNTVSVACFLFFTQLKTAVREPPPPSSGCLSRRFRPLVNSAFRCKATRALEKKFIAVTPA